ncbi:MAG: ABC transporter permease subunit [Verrucomicrobiota bacterium]
MKLALTPALSPQEREAPFPQVGAEFEDEDEDEDEDEEEEEGALGKGARVCEDVASGAAKTTGIMTAFPIVRRELSVAARQSRTYWSRLTNAGILFLIVLGMLAFTPFAPRQIGQQLLYYFTFFAFIFAMTSGLHLTADCISGEKRDGTLGLLFLTDLKGYDVVFGKLAATSLRAGYGLMSTLPVMSVLLLLGGVTLAEVLRVLLVLLNTMFFSLSAGLLCSSLLTQLRSVTSWSALIVMGFVGGLPLLGAAVMIYFEIKNIPMSKEWWAPFLVGSPGFACAAALDAMHTGLWKKMFWVSVSITHALSWLMLVLACVMLPHRWQDKPQSVTRRRWSERLKDLLQGNAATRAAYRRRLLDVNAVFWLTARDRLKPVTVWLFIAAAGGLWWWGYAKMGNDWLVPPVAIGGALILQGVLKFWLAGEVVKQFSDDHRSGALELILCTPLKVEEILRGQVFALQRQFFWPTIGVLCADGLLLMSVYAHRGTWGMSQNDLGELALTFFAGMTIFVADLVALTWLGMWKAMTAKDVKRAAGDTIVRVMVVPWLLFQFSMGFFAFAFWKLNIRFSPEFWMILGWWFVINFSVDMFFWQHSRNQLLQNFRALAMQRYLPARPHKFWTVLGRKFGEFKRALSGA